MRFQTRQTAATLLALAIAPLAVVAEPVVTKKTAASGVSLSLFGRDRSVPAATVKIARLTIGAQRKGFFRVGVLPLAVGQGVEIVFRKPDVTALNDLGSAMETLARSAELELHGVKFFAPGAVAPCASAGLARAKDGESWQLSDLTLAPARRIGRATLRTAGADAGLLIFDENGSATKFQFLFTP